MDPIVVTHEIPIWKFIEDMNGRGICHARILSSYVIGEVQHIEVEYTFTPAPTLITLEFDLNKEEPFKKETV